jgi:hypothetical protein
MKRWKYVVIAAVVIGLIVAVVQWGRQPVELPVDKSQYVEANWDEIERDLEANLLKPVYVRGVVEYVDELSSGEYLLLIVDPTGGPFEIDTSGGDERKVKFQCRKLREGDRVIVWGYVWRSDTQPVIRALLIEKK